MKLLLKREDIDTDSPDRDGRIPLSFAASGRHEKVVKILLEHGDPNPDLPDSNGRTPLPIAASRRHEGVVKLLQEHMEATLIYFEMMAEHPYSQLPGGNM